MTEAATSSPSHEFELLAAVTKQSFERKEFKNCVGQADKIRTMWLASTPNERQRMRKTLWPALRVGCLASFKINEVERGLAFYNEVLREKNISWDLGLRVAKNLARLGQKERLVPIIEQLRGWSQKDQTRAIQFENFLKTIGQSNISQQNRLVASMQKLASPHFKVRPENAPETDSIVSVSALRRTVFKPSSGRYSIVINPKSACSTLKFNLWRQEFKIGTSKWPPPKGHNGIHRKQKTAIHKVPVRELEAALLEKPVFSIVRNPYTRVLSAYLDKIVGSKKEKRHLLLVMGYVEDAPITFGDFVNFICKQNSQEMDAHYAPQAFLMQIDHLPYTYIGCVEEMDESIAAIVTTAYEVVPETAEEFRPHRTGASSLIKQYYTDELAAKVFERFRIDFDSFGYSTDRFESHLPPKQLKRAAENGRHKAESILRPVLQAAAAEETKNYVAAFEILSKVESDDPEVAFTKARLLIKLGRPAEALPILENVVIRVANVSHYWMLLAECRVTLRLLNDAVSAAETAAFIAPSDHMLSRARRVMRRAREREKAKVYKDRLIAIKELTFLSPLALRLQRTSVRHRLQAMARAIATHWPL